MDRKGFWWTLISWLLLLVTVPMWLAYVVGGTVLNMIGWYQAPWSAASVLTGLVILAGLVTGIVFLCYHLSVNLSLGWS